MKEANVTVKMDIEYKSYLITEQHTNYLMGRAQVLRAGFFLLAVAMKFHGFS